MRDNVEFGCLNIHRVSSTVVSCAVAYDLAAVTAFTSVKINLADLTKAFERRTTHTSSRAYLLVLSCITMLVLRIQSLVLRSSSFCLLGVLCCERSSTWLLTFCGID